MRLCANENIPEDCVLRLRQDGHDVLWIRETTPGVSDDAVLEGLHVPLEVLSNGSWTSTFPTEPTLGNAVTIAGTSYRVVKLDHSQDGLELVLGLKGVNR